MDSRNKAHPSLWPQHLSHSPAPLIPPTLCLVCFAIFCMLSLHLYLVFYHDLIHVSNVLWVIPRGDMSTWHHAFRSRNLWNVSRFNSLLTINSGLIYSHKQASLKGRYCFNKNSYVLKHSYGFYLRQPPCLSAVDRTMAHPPIPKLSLHFRWAFPWHFMVLHIGLCWIG